MRKPPLIWTADMDAAVLERYASDGPSAVAMSLGIAPKQVSRRADHLGVRTASPGRYQRTAKRPPPIPTLLELLERPPVAALQVHAEKRQAPGDHGECLAAIRQEFAGEQFTRGDMQRRLGW